MKFSAIFCFLWGGVLCDCCGGERQAAPAGFGVFCCLGLVLFGFCVCVTHTQQCVCLAAAGGRRLRQRARERFTPAQHLIHVRAAFDYSRRGSGSDSEQYFSGSVCEQLH